MQKIRWAVCLILVLVSKCLAQEPDVLYLSWAQNPDTSMAIYWHRDEIDEKDLGMSESSIFYREKEPLLECAPWKEEEASFEKAGSMDVCIYRADLKSLKANTDYVFRIGLKGQEYFFRTMPKVLEKEIRFAVGGDIDFETKRFKKMSEDIALLDPDFVVLGGDIAYAIENITDPLGSFFEYYEWEKFFKGWKETMVTSEGRLIPLVAVPGNHDVKSSSSKKLSQLFYKLFPFPYKDCAYRTLLFGDYLKLVLLDTGHGKAIEGDQTEWLSNTLKEKNGLYTYAVYHVSAFPGYYAYTNKKSVLLRDLWVPLFEEYGVLAAFENHNHCYKRTHPLKNGAICKEGVVYFGDGSWGVRPRKPKNSKAWYMAESKAVNSFFFVRVNQNKTVVEPRGFKGKLIDTPQVFYPKGVE